MDEHRLAAVFAGGGEEQAKTSTGYVIASRLFLTAAHAVEAAGTIEVQFIDQADPMPCDVIWNGRAHNLDAALLEVDASHWPPGAPAEPVRFGRLVTLMPGTPAQTIGFPAAQRDPDGELETAHVNGHINPGDKLVSGQWVLTVAGTPPENLDSSPWTGLSGGPLYCGELLCGVVVVDPPHWQHGKLDAVPAHRLLQNEEFRALLRDRLGYLPVAEAAELQSLSESATLSRPPQSLPELLRPQTEAVRFFGREQQMAEFRVWCGGDGVKARLLTGPGGQGKTRFARELAQALAAEGWVVVQLHDSAPAESYQILGKVSPHLLLIMDYADTRPGSVAEVMRVLEEESNRSAVRILLIARSAGEWWDQLPASASAYISLLSGAAVVQLAALADDLPTRQSLYRAALTDLARGLRRLPDYASVDWESVARALPAADLSNARLSSALTLQIRALTDLLTAHPEAQPGQPGDTVEAQFLRHERNYWTKTARRRPLLQELSEDELADAVAVATLTRVSGKERAVELLANVPRLRNTPERVRSALASWLSDLYPASTESYWGALEPDRLGEYHAGARVEKGSAFLQDFLPALNTAEAERALTVLARAGAQPVCPSPGLLDQVAALITTHPESLAVPAAAVATQSENPDFLIEALTSLAARSDLPVDLLENLNTAFPAQTAGLAEPALNIADCLVRANRMTVRRTWLFPAASQPREIPGPDNSAPPTLISARTAARADLARAYHNYSHRLMGLGNWDEAIAAGGHAIRLYRRLARRHPDLYRSLLAGSLDNQAIALGSTSRLEEALKASQQARAVHRVLAADDTDAHLVGLARSLSNASGIFAALNAHQAALNTSTEAVTILSQLASRKRARYLPELASALHNQASDYAQGGWYDEAEAASGRAVAIRRPLAVQRPDANLPGLAHSLHNFSIDLMATEKAIAALKVIDESISIYLRLVLDKGSSYLPYLANALNTKTAQCRGRNRMREAVIASARSVLFYMRLARERPADFQADLAVALETHRWARIEAGLIQHKKWDVVLEEATELIHRDLPTRNQPDRDQTLKEDEEIRRLATEVVTVNDVEVEESWPAVEAAIIRYSRSMPGGEHGSELTASGAVRPARGFAERMRAVWRAPRRWRRRSYRRRRSWRQRWRAVTRMLRPRKVVRSMSSIVKFKANKALERHRDPRESLDYSYQRQLERLTKLRRGVADVAYQCKRAELQIESLRRQLARLERAAERAQGADSDNPAAEASRREAAQNQLNDLERQYQTLQADEKWLTAVSLRFQQKVDGFRIQKEVLKATYSAAEARNRIGEAFSGITNELGEIGMAMRRAQDKTTHMQARSDATEELRASGAFDDITALSPEEFPDELERIETHIDAELARLKAEISAGPARAIARSTGNGDQASAAGQPHAGEGS